MTTAKRVLLPGLAAVAVAAGAATAVAAMAMAAGVDFELPDGGESIPLLGFSQLTIVFGVVGLLLALALRRWVARPARAWVRMAVALTAVSLVPPFLVGATLATECALVLVHLVAAAIVIPVVARRLAA
ncbi:DUF6069 family protein [Virgisporangium ochraceum]|uniref:Uncharacterized protein n=1 Tax=Virgisporangium ochraceum TaxID=65505 RepID=A0A8J3ZXZ3_9ACTN|nr:DUF6069 family protein [Virgisporangium ochraceum]GIJ72164.1 hypothetical protein Voc01_070810 [Virgisporangium ochraceum]